MSGRELDDYRAREKRLTDHGVPDDLASRVAVLAPAYALLGIVETADRLGLDPVEVARVHFALGERLGLPALVERIFALPRDDRWQTMARAALRDDLYGVHQQLTAQVLESTDADDSAPARVAAWEDADEELVGRAASDPGGDLPRGDRRPGPAVGRAAGGARPAVLTRAYGSSEQQEHGGHDARGHDGPAEDRVGQLAADAGADVAADQEPAASSTTTSQRGSATTTKIRPATMLPTISDSVLRPLTMRSSRSVPRPRTATIITPAPAPK